MKQLYIDIATKLRSIIDTATPYTYVQGGLSGITFSGTYTGGLAEDLFQINIDGYNDPDADTFAWSSAHGSGTLVPITGTAQYLIDGISVTFDAVTGHSDRINYDWKYTINNGTPLLKFVQIWNNQLALQEEAKTYSFATPCVFIELIAPSTLGQLGNGAQIYDPLIVRLHIVHTFYNATDGNGVQEQDLTIFDLRQQIYEAMQDFEPDDAVAFFRSSESQDFEHNNVYHFIQEFTTNYTDRTRERPYKGFIKQPPTDYEETTNSLKSTADFT